MYISNAAVLKHGPRILDTRFHLELESMSPPLACAIRFVMTLTERLTVRPLKLRQTKKFLSGPQEIHSWDATTIPWVSEWKSLGCVWFFVTPWTVATRLLCPCNSPGKNTGVGSRSLLQGIFPTQGLHPGLPHCRQILYHLSHQGSPMRSSNLPTQRKTHTGPQEHNEREIWLVLNCSSFWLLLLQPSLVYNHNICHHMRDPPPKSRTA